MKIKALSAFYGDATLISWTMGKDKRNILIDGGPAKTYPRCLSTLLTELRTKNEIIDLLIITHCDHDHIGGILKLYADIKQDKSIIKQIWFNSGNLIAKHISDVDAFERDFALLLSDQKEMSYKEGNTLEKLLTDNHWEGQLISAPDTKYLYEARIDILSPNYEQLVAINDHWEVEVSGRTEMSEKKSDYHESIENLIKKPFVHDTSRPNGSSIAFLIRIGQSSFLALADAFPSVIEENLRKLSWSEDKKLQVGAVKVSHHGSKFNNSSSLYSIIESSQYIITTDGTRDNLPHKEALSRIVVANPECSLYFNYKKPSKIFTSGEMEKYNFTCVNLEEWNYTIEI